MVGRFLRFLFTIILFAGIAGVLGFVWLMGISKNPGTFDAPRIVLIHSGTGTRAIADTLKSEKIIDNDLAFTLAVLTSGNWGKLQAGEYEFPARATMRIMIDQMAQGQVYQRYITIPEGITVYDALHIIEQANGLSGDITTIPNEGIILPETYAYTHGMTRDGLITRMTADMNKTVQELWAKRPPEFPLKDINAVLTLASIIEKETGVASERPQIASVFFNRLQTGMKLQSDPTVIYALTKGQGKLDRPLYTKDLTDTHSPYNTYWTAGLPPGPIANPGRASIMAVFQPAQTDYFYFVADGTGGHVFARTLDEHNKNVAQWRKIQAQKTSIVESSLGPKGQ